MKYIRRDPTTDSLADEDVAGNLLPLCPAHNRPLASKNLNLPRKVVFDPFHQIGRGVETFFTKKNHLDYLNYGSQYNICPGCLFTQYHKPFNWGRGKSASWHRVEIIRAFAFIRVKDSLPKAGLSPPPPLDPCTSPVHLPTTLLGTLCPGRTVA